MNYLPRNRGRGGTLKKAGFLVALFLAGALIFSLSDRLIISLAIPIWNSENVFSQTFKRTLNFFHSQASLVEENQRLEEKILSLELERLSNPPMLGGLGSLYELLDRAGEGAGITSTVITHPPQSSYDFIIADAGSRDAVVTGAKVRLLEGPEIGSVVEVFPNFSKIKLFSSSLEKTNAVLERGEEAVVLEGLGAGNFKIVVPRDSVVEVGDRVLSASLGHHLLAVVQAVDLKPTDSFKEILAKSPVNIFSIRYISIVP